jgi:hypothetical protein
MATTSLSTLEDFEPFTIINDKALHTELIQQSDLFYRVSKNHADAVSKRDHCKYILDKLDSDLAIRMRMSAIESGEKTTEKKIEEMVAVHPDHVSTTENYLKYKCEADRWAALSRSLEQRADMLRELVGLHKTGYFGTGLGGTASDVDYEMGKEALIKART